MFAHALHYLKQGLNKDQGVLLISNLFSIRMALTMVNNLWGKDYASQLKEHGHILTANTSEWNLQDKSKNRGDTHSLMTSAIRLVMGKNKRHVRIFVDLGVEHHLHSLLENELALQSLSSITLIMCGYLQSEIMSLDSYTFTKLQKCHSISYVIPRICSPQPSVSGMKHF
jgi:hypothetical protein